MKKIQIKSKAVKWSAAILPFLLGTQLQAQNPCDTVLSLQMFSGQNYNGYDVSCNGGFDGTIGTIVNGGASPITYQWSTGHNAQYLTGVPAGSYSLTVTEANGCSQTETVLLTEPSALSINAYTLINDTGYDILCNGNQSGTGIVDANGGVGSYSYLWSNGDQNSTALGLSGGSYSVQVTDLNGCLAQANIQILEPSAITLSTKIEMKANGNQLSAPGATDGVIVAQATGGMGFFTFEWSTGYVGDTLSNVGAGTYTVTVTDMYGCTKVSSATLVNPSLFTVSNNPAVSLGGGSLNNGANGSKGQSNGSVSLRPVMPQGISPNADGLNDYFIIKNIENYPDNTLRVYNMNGAEVATIQNYSNEWSGLSKTNQELPAGTYAVVFTYKDNGVEKTVSGKVIIRK